MENYLLCGELCSSAETQRNGFNRLSPDIVVYKGRRKGSVQFVGIHRHNKQDKKYVENGVQLMHSLDHSNVLQFVEWYETPQHIWVITELAVGGSLAELLKQDGYLPDTILDEFVRDIVAGLNYIHSKGILYCDLQPAKVALDSCQLLKLSDFTLARTLGNSQHEYDFKSLVHTLLEPSDKPLQYSPSPLYAAPELYQRQCFSVASDLWSLGCTVYELSLGCRAFESNDCDELVHSILSVQPNIALPASHTVAAQLLTTLLISQPANRTTPYVT